MITLEGGIGNHIFLRGRKYSYFGGNNYLGLANHPSVREAVIKAVKKYGVNFSASRCTTGTSLLHIELEKQLSLFKGKEDSVVFASGYMGNSILLEILKDNYPVIIADELSHSSIISAFPRDIPFFYYKHCDSDHLDHLILQHKILRPLVITDGVFALTGEIAPLDKIYRVVKKHKGILVSDDAHSTGILGDTGKGTPEYFNLHEEKNIFQTETMSKALGGYGGFISGNRNLTDKIREKSNVFQASTALPPPVVAAGIAALKIIMENPGLRITLLKKANRIRKELLDLGFSTSGNNTPIIPVFFNSSDKANSLSLYLEKNGIIVPSVNYPSRQKMNLLRITVSAKHTAGQIDTLLEKLTNWIKANGKNKDR